MWAWLLLQLLQVTHTSCCHVFFCQTLCLGTHTVLIAYSAQRLQESHDISVTQLLLQLLQWHVQVIAVPQLLLAHIFDAEVLLSRNACPASTPVLFAVPLAHTLFLKAYAV